MFDVNDIGHWRTYDVISSHVVMFSPPERWMKIDGRSPFIFDERIRSLFYIESQKDCINILNYVDYKSNPKISFSNQP